MHLAFLDEATELACTDPARAHALWGPEGAREVARAIGLLVASTTLGVLRRFRTIGVVLTDCGELRCVTITNGATQVFTVPVDARGALLIPERGDNVESLDLVSRMQVFDVLHEGRATGRGRAA